MVADSLLACPDQCGEFPRSPCFDLYLLHCTKNAGTRVVQPARCESIADGGTVHVRDLETNEMQAVVADHVILSDGKQQPSGDFGIKAHFEGIDGLSGTIELFCVNRGYGGIAPIEGGHAMLPLQCRKGNCAIAAEMSRGSLIS